MNFNWLLVHLLPSIGFILALTFFSHILRERRSPTSTLAWLLANMDMRSLLLTYEIDLCIYDSDAIRQLETWMLGLKKDCAARKLQSKSSFGLLESVGRLFAPLL